MSNAAELGEDPDVRELGELTRALLAHVEWQRTTGATGLPRATTALASSRAPSEMSFEPAAAPQIARPSSVAEAKMAMGAPTGAEDIASSVGSVGYSRTAGVASSAPKSMGIAPEAVAPAPESRAWSGSLPVGDPARSTRLSVLAQEISGCTRCGLHAGRTQTVFARGTGSSGVCFVGEGPGAEEDAQGFPFVGAAGQLLDRMILAMGLGRDEVYVCNIVKCRPPNNRKPSPEEMRTCTPYLAEQLELIQPKVIVALGATAVEGLLGASGGITRIRGTFRLYKGRIPVMPTFHPAYLLRTPEAKREVWSDLQAVMKHLGLPAPNPKSG